MFRKQDFKKVELLGSGKKNTKIYKALHIPTGKYYALKEVEAKTLDKLNEYKVIITLCSSFLNLGRGSIAVQSPKSSKCHSVLRILLLRNHVQHIQNWNSL